MDGSQLLAIAAAAPAPDTAIIDGAVTKLQRHEDGTITASRKASHDERAGVDPGR